MEERKILRNSILSQAKYFLEKFDEFYPFGSIITIKNELKPFSVSSKEEHPGVNDVLKEIVEGFKERILLNKYKAVAIGLDVIFTVPETGEKIDSIEIRIDSKKENSINYYVPYRKENGKIIFIEIYEDVGSLNVFNNINQ